MSNGIHGYNAIRRYQQAYQAGGVKQCSDDASRDRVTGAQPSSQATAAAPSKGLTMEEQRVIDRYFPPEPALQMRLYGPGNATKTVSPGALGSRLDLQG